MIFVWQMWASHAWCFTLTPFENDDVPLCAKCKRTSGALSKNSSSWKWLPLVNLKKEAIRHDWQQSHEFYEAISSIHVDCANGVKKALFFDSYTETELKTLRKRAIDAFWLSKTRINLMEGVKFHFHSDKCIHSIGMNSTDSCVFLCKKKIRLTFRIMLSHPSRLSGKKWYSRRSCIHKCWRSYVKIILGGWSLDAKHNLSESFRTRTIHF